ncbi:MAG: hypothetical protein BGO27_03565 [Alphaproteobacteria bacterium 33-17]|nr:MAG: hypothetical protein BGO27_03565 [Alphaproteobacteria bacterium 33-17]
MNIEHEQIFYINSRKKLKEDESHSDFSYFLDLNQNIDYTHVVLLNCSIPKSYYNVQKNSSFILTEGTDSVTIDFPPSNYSRTSFKNIAQQLLNQNSPHNYQYTISFQNINTIGEDGKLTYTVSGVDVSDPQPIFTFNNTLFELFGFDKNKSYQFTSNVIRSVNVCNMNKESTLFLRSNIVQNQGNNILHDIISFSDPSYSYIIYESNGNLLENAKKFSRDKSNIYQFWLTNEDDDRIDLNGLNMIFKIMVYKQNKITEFQEKPKKINN